MSFDRNIKPPVPQLLHDSNPTPQVVEALEYFKSIKILQDRSWTKSVPYKNWFTYLKPSESIANSYTPSAAKFRIKQLGKQQHHGKSSNTEKLNINGELGYPSAAYVKAHEEEVARKKKEKTKLLESLPDNVISLFDLADGSWLRKKAEKRQLKIQENKEKFIKRKKEKFDNEILEKEVG